MPDFHLSEHFIGGHIPFRQEVLHQDADVVSTEQGIEGTVLAAHLSRKQQSQHTQQHMVLSASPLSHLIVAHSDGPFGVLQGSLDEVTLALHKSQTLGFGVFGCVGERVLDFLWRVDFPSNDQVPTRRPSAGFIPHPHAAMENLYLQKAPFTSPQTPLFPSPGGLGFQPVIHSDSSHRTDPFGLFFARLEVVGTSSGAGSCR
jgi:hypothetical protein